MISREEWRHALDKVADAYDRFRPGYPSSVPEDVEVLAGLPKGGRILEVGCGTGQLTTVFASRGHPLVAVEPGPALASLARRNGAAYPNLRIVVSTLEDWVPDEPPFDLVLAAQSFHLLDPARRFQAAARVLSPAGALAVVWSYRMPGDSPAHQVLQAADARHTPTLKPDQADQDTPFEDDMDRSGRFGSVFMRRYRWTQIYSAAEYVGLLASMGTHHLQPEPARSALFQEVGEGIERAGGRISINYLTRLYVARVLT